MAYILNGTTIRRPNTMRETNNKLMVQQRVLSGSYRRDSFGTKKRIWVLDYEFVNSTDYDAINSIYTTYLTTNAGVTWEITETNYTVSSTTVHVDLLERDFTVKGTDYLSSFTLTLTEV